MVKISIVCLIYKSSKMADWVYNSVHKFTPQIKRGEAEFFFIANNPTEAVVNHLDKKGYKYYLNICPKFKDEELFKMGYGKPAYISEVYNGYNRGILEANGEIVILINSDNYFSPDWLDGLLKYLDRKSIITSQLVERKHPKYEVFPGAYHQECGNTPENFDERKFLKFAESVRKSGLVEGSAYMPCAFYKDLALQVGLYPEGNIAGDTFDEIIGTGDEVFFRMLKRIGVKHLTSLDSIVYHLKEGEMDESINFVNQLSNIKDIKVDSLMEAELKKINLIKSKSIELYKRFAYTEVNAIMLMIKNEKYQKDFINQKKELLILSNELNDKSKLWEEFIRLQNSKAVVLSNKLKKILSKLKIKKF